jgi:predicted amidohydrolase
MKIAHCQLQCTPGEFDVNFAKVLAGLQRAQDAGAQIVSFPECFLTGYQETEDAVRKHAFAVDSQRMAYVLEKTRHFDPTLVVGFNELRGNDLYNTVMVSHAGKLQGTYSKCAAYMPFHKQGREFPVFTRGDLKFGILICADGGYPDPARILALKGAQAIIAPHYNYIGPNQVLGHFMAVRADHAARARENRVYFLRANNVSVGKDPTFSFEGVGYGDSYVIDPNGEILVRSRRHVEDFILADIDTSLCEDKAWGGKGKSAWSLEQFRQHLLDALQSRR